MCARRKTCWPVHYSLHVTLPTILLSDGASAGTADNRAEMLPTPDGKFDFTGYIADETMEGLVDKYGLVPQSAYPESKHSQNSRGLNMVLTKKLREYARDIRADRAEGRREAMLSETYDLLVRFLGKPPTEFTWAYYDKAGKVQLLGSLGLGVTF